MDYFKLAVDLMKLEAAPTLARVAQKHTHLRTIKKPQQVCACSAYDFPHRTGSGNCPGFTEYATDPRPAWHREEEVIFNANEIRTMEKA